MKRFALKILIPALCIVLAVLGLEGLMRLLPTPSASPGYEYVKNAGIFYKHGQPGVNSMGFQDRERQKAKPAGVYRILLLGDSFLDGTKVDVYMQ